jgi:hypothetical protein
LDGTIRNAAAPVEAGNPQVRLEIAAIHGQKLTGRICSGDGVTGNGLAGLKLAVLIVAAASWSGAAMAQALPPPSYAAPLRSTAPSQATTPSPSANMLPPAGGIGTVPAIGQTRSIGQIPTALGGPMPGVPAAAAAMPMGPAPLPGAGGASQVSLSLAARYGRDVPGQITNGLLWRVFPARPDSAGNFRAVKEDRSANPVMALPPGDYVVHVSYGLASAAKAVRLKEAMREVLEIPAGGIKLEGRVGDVRIPAGQISFDIYKGSQFDAGEKTPLVQGVGTGDVVVVVPEGAYHIVSNYGDTNAVVRSDIRVQAGKLTDVVVNHRAALITLKLVSERGGDPIASNTSWSVITPGGDVIKESNGVFPRLVLAEGDYRAIARNDGRTYERDFKVITGVDGEVEVLAR